MKKTILSMAVLAIIVSVAVSACSKDDANAVKDTPRVVTQTNNGWPEGALTSGDDTYLYDVDERRDLNRIDSMLCVYYHYGENPLNNLPSGYCPVLPVNFPISQTDSLKGMVVLFENRNRDTAIEELKRVEGILAIEPVYRNGGSLELYGPGVQVMVSPGHEEEERIIESIANSLGYSLQHSIPSYRLYVGNHPLVSAVAACNIIKERRVLDTVFITPGFVRHVHEYK